MIEWLRRVWRRHRPAGAAIPAPSQGKRTSPSPWITRDWRYLTLHFAQATAQSRMSRWHPDQLLIGYTRTMLAGLLWCPAPRQIGMVGLGGGSQLRFCRRWLPEACIEAIEIDPRVIALRRKFRIPDDDARLRVVEADAAVLLPERPAAYDLLLIDGYDAEGVPPALSTVRFHAACRAALAADGVLASNLFGAGVDAHIERMRRVFGSRLRVVSEPGMSNRVVFAWRGEMPPPERLQPAFWREHITPGWRDPLTDAFERVARTLRTRRP